MTNLSTKLRYIKSHEELIGLIAASVEARKICKSDHLTEDIEILQRNLDEICDFKIKTPSVNFIGLLLVSHMKRQHDSLPLQFLDKLNALLPIALAITDACINLSFICESNFTTDICIAVRISLLQAIYPTWSPLAQLPNIIETEAKSLPNTPTLLSLCNKSSKLTLINNKLQVCKELNGKVHENCTEAAVADIDSDADDDAQMPCREISIHSPCTLMQHIPTIPGVTLSNQEIIDIKDFLIKIPNLKITVTTVVEGEELPMEGDYLTVKVVLERANIEGDIEFGPAHTPFFPHPVAEKFIVILRNPNKSLPGSFRHCVMNSSSTSVNFVLPCTMNGTLNLTVEVKSLVYKGVEFSKPITADIKPYVAEERSVFLHQDDLDLDKRPTIFQLMSGIAPDIPSSDSEQE